MCKIMEALNQTALYRVDLYPVEKSTSLRASLRKPMSILRRRQEERGSGSRRDYDGKDVLDNYEDLIEKYDSSPHFIANIMVMANGKENAVAVLDSAGSEGLIKGKYSIGTFSSRFSPLSFLEDEDVSLENIKEKMIVKKGKTGLVICREDTANLNLNYLPTLFSLEEIAPFFRFPALYDGEVIQIAKETAPVSVGKKGSLFLGKDKNGYDVFFPLSLLPKHAFISGVPGSGKTNTMHHITSSLWKDHHIPFLVLEPAKQEYRALANDPGMKDLWLFSPNADMSFPLHINPFEMPKGTLVSEHIRNLCSVFEGAFPFEPPAPFLLDTSIEAIYRQLGWLPDHRYTGEETDENGKKRPLPTVSMLYSQFEKEMEATSYGEETKGSLKSILQVRIGSLLRRELGDIFDVPESTLKPEEWLEKPAVIELESMGRGPANFLTLMLCSLIREALKANPSFDGDVRHVMFIEEAHNLIGPESEEQTGADADPKKAATAFVVKMLAEVRALKEGIVIADQLPTVMAQEVLKNTGLKIGLRITSADDRALLGSTMAASGMQLEEMSTFEIGQALIFYEKLRRPFTMRIKEWWGELTDKEEKEEMVTPKRDAELRAALVNSETYQKENIESIRIILDKYIKKCGEINNRVMGSENILDYLFAQSKKVDELLFQLEQAESNQIQLSEEKKQTKQDQLQNLLLLYEEKKNSEKIRKEPMELLTMLSGWVDDLERLKNGRWARFGAPDEIMVDVTTLQGKICLEIIKLHKKLALGLKDPAIMVKADIIQKHAVQLSREFSEDIKAYNRIYNH